MVKNISKENLEFLDRHNRDYALDLTRVASSSSQLSVGDVITFNYYAEGYNGASRIALVVQPVTKQAGTGNRLLSVVNISPSMNLTPQVINDLYKNRASLGEDQYRTFILNSRVKNILRIEPISQWLTQAYDDLEEELS